MKKGTIISAVFLVIGSFSFGQGVYSYFRPVDLDDGWNTGHLPSRDVDTTGIVHLFDQLRSSQHQIHGILLVKNNQLIIEAYFDTYAANRQHDLRSATKSITSLLMGIAVDQGFVASVDEPVFRYLPNLVPGKNRDARKSQITIRHLLTMATGLDCNDWDQHSEGQEDKVYRKKDWLQYFLDLPMIAEPGQGSYYCTMAQVLAMEVISQASGMPIDEFAERYLFGPLNIRNVSWGHTSRKEVIASGKRLYMTPRDMAKIGQLVLNGGQWDGKQLISEKWIKEATSVQTNISGFDYGFLWWIIPFETDETTLLARAATGNGGQYILVYPEAELVAVFTGGAYNSQDDKLPLMIMKEVFLPAFGTEK